MESLSQLSKSLFQLFTGLCLTRATVFYAVFRHLFHLPPVTAVLIIRHTRSLGGDLTASFTTLFAFAFFGFPFHECNTCDIIWNQNQRAEGKHNH